MYRYPIRPDGERRRSTTRTERMGINDSRMYFAGRRFPLHSLNKAGAKGRMGQRSLIVAFRCNLRSGRISRTGENG